MRDPLKPEDLLRGILKDARGDLKRTEFREALDEILGLEIAKHCHVRGFRSGKLVVEIDSAPLYAEFRGFRAEEIRLAINERLSKQKVALLVFRMGGTGHV